MKCISTPRRGAGFTLAELLVSSTLIVMIMGFLMVTVQQTQRTVKNTTAKIGQFQAARLAFDALTRNLSQATLNTYYDLDFDKFKNPIRFRRQSDLHFVVDASVSLFKTDDNASANKVHPPLATVSDENYPGHAVFFQAPIGVTAEGDTVRKYRNLNGMLNAVGYFVEWNEDASLPDFISERAALAPKRYRYRLMEVSQPGETNMIYHNSNYTTVPLMTVAPTNTKYNQSRDWINASVGRKVLPMIPAKGGGTQQNSARVLAENVTTLIIIPKLSERDRKPDRLDELTGPSCSYDTRPQSAYNAQKRVVDTAVNEGDVLTGITVTEKKQLHKLPPILQVTMVAIDEESAARWQSFSDSPPDWCTGLFRSFTTETAFYQQLGNAKDGSTSLIGRMANPGPGSGPKMNYRVFTTDVVLRSSKWSNDPIN